MQNLRNLTLALLVCIAGGVQGASFDPNDPILELGCDTCHLNVTGGGQVPKGNADILADTQELLCGLCHQGAIVGGHPSGVIPADPTPVEYPLDWKQEVTCSTCHLVHQNRHVELRPPPSGLDNCSGCHAL